MYRFICYAVLPVASLCAQPESLTCTAGGVQCAEGLTLLQQAGQIKKVALQEEDLKPSGAFSYEPIIATVTLGKYPGYKGSKGIRGHVNISVVHEAVTLTWSLSGTDNHCDSGPKRIDAKANACGLHIHSGRSCNDRQEVGAHFYKSREGGKNIDGEFEIPVQSEDPWVNVMYRSKKGHSNGTMSVKGVGKTLDQIIGRTFVAHDSSGARVACGLVKALVAVATESTQEDKSAALSAKLAFAALLTILVALQLIHA